MVIQGILVHSLVLSVARRAWIFFSSCRFTDLAILLDISSKYVSLILALFL